MLSYYISKDSELVTHCMWERIKNIRWYIVFLKSPNIRVGIVKNHTSVRLYKLMGGFFHQVFLPLIHFVKTGALLLTFPSCRIKNVPQQRIQYDLWKERPFREAVKGCMCLTTPATELQWLFSLASETSMLTSLSHWVEKLYWAQQHSSTLSTYNHRNQQASVSLCPSLCLRIYITEPSKKT